MPVTRHLFVFDAQVDIEKIDLKLVSKDDHVYIFPLTSRSALVQSIEQKFKTVTGNVHTLASAHLSNQMADRLREKYLQFVAALPEKAKGKNFKEYFAIDSAASLWWFSLVSEKSTLKTDIFNNLVQLHSMVDVIRQYGIGKIWFASQNAKLRNNLIDYVRKQGLQFLSLPVKKIKNIKYHLRDFQGFFYLKHVLILIANMAVFLKRALVINRTLKKLPRKKLSPDDIMLITYYPYLDKSKANEGVFHNKFYSGLDQALTAQGEGIVWIAIYAGNNSVTFNESVQYAKTFIERGYSIYFLEEFFGATDFLRAFWLTVVHGLKFLRKEQELSRLTELEGVNFMPLMRDDWYTSFVGKVGFSGLMYYFMFKNMLRTIRTKKCLYFLEMQAWEKALAAAKETTGSTTQIFGYQHATVPTFLLNYFNDRSEVVSDGTYRLAGPDKIICNGDLTFGYLRHCGWSEDRLLKAEAIRYNHLKKSRSFKDTGKKNMVLVACSISPEESSVLLNIAHHAVKELKDVILCVRPHPFLNLERLFEMAEIPKEERTYELKTGPLDELLAEVKAVIVGSSGVSVEALAFGCNVIIVEVAELFNMSPLRGISSPLIRTVSSMEELRTTILTIMRQQFNTQENLNSSRDLIHRFFNLNHETDIPRQFMTYLTSTKNGRD